jgi:2-phosphosulfolactate phosphatase
VLSFTTALTVAVERGISVLPYPWRDDTAAEVARQHRATLAVSRSRAGPGQVSLSPQSIARAGAGIERLVLPSPNGSAIASRLAAAGVTVVGVCLRNAPAAAAWVRDRAGDRPVAVVAAGERHPDGSLRPAVEDLWGAGAFLAALVGAGSAGVSDPPVGRGQHGGISPEAGAALAAYGALPGSLGDALRASVSGRELRSSGFAGDVAVAGALGVSEAVPVLRRGWFVDGGS